MTEKGERRFIPARYAFTCGGQVYRWGRKESLMHCQEIGSVIADTPDAASKLPTGWVQSAERGYLCRWCSQEQPRMLAGK